MIKGMEDLKNIAEVCKAFHNTLINTSPTAIDDLDINNNTNDI
jgi:hypothetical protein